MAQELMDRVIEIVGRNALHNADKVSETSILKADHGIDSLKIVDLIMDLEDEFKITVDNNAIVFENFSTVENIVKYITLKL